MLLEENPALIDFCRCCRFREYLSNVLINHRPSCSLIDRRGAQQVKSLWFSRGPDHGPGSGDDPELCSAHSAFKNDGPCASPVNLLGELTLDQVQGS